MPSIDSLISVVLSLILFSIGSSLELKDFYKFKKQQSSLLLGLFLQIVFLPFLAFTLMYFAPISNVWKMGIFILAISPGGSMSNFISYIVKADVSLSLALTAINSIFILLSIPLLTAWALDYYLDISSNLNLDMFQNFLPLIFILLVPSILGILFRHYFKNLALKFQVSLKLVTSILLAIIFGVKIFASTENGGSGLGMDSLFSLVPWVFSFHVLALVFSYWLSKKLNLSNAEATTIAIEVGLQNTTLALLITSILGQFEMSQPIVVYAMFSFFSTLLFALIVMKRKQNDKSKT